MSTRAKWMPSEEVVLAATLGSLNVARLDREFLRTGLRAKLAILEDILQFFSPDGLSLGEENWLIAKTVALKSELEKGLLG